jgi:hypothetical protein
VVLLVYVLTKLSVLARASTTIELNLVHVVFFFQCTEAELRALCLPSGQVVSCKFHRKDNGQPKGYALLPWPSLLV